MLMEMWVLEIECHFEIIIIIVVVVVVVVVVVFICWKKR
jgi:hypothetical protein